MTDSHHLVVEDDPDPADLAFLEGRLAAAAVSAVGIGDERELGVFVRDDEGQIVAGAFGSVWGGGCQVHAIWVDETLRGHGLAHELLGAIEAAARDRGCRLLMGLTYDVLTGDLYDRLGWQVVGVIENCPAGTSTRWYRKDLAEFIPSG